VNVADTSHEPGFREFHKYLSDPSPSEKKYQEAAEEMKFANRQYAQRQNSWIRNKFLPAVWASKAADGGKSTEAYLLDTSGLDYPFYSKQGDRRLIVELILQNPKDGLQQCVT
jgi:tRNA A37 N6-isopentenylltransferase MiaA